MNILIQHQILVALVKARTVLNAQTLQIVFLVVLAFYYLIRHLVAHNINIIIMSKNNVNFVLIEIALLAQMKQIV